MWQYWCVYVGACLQYICARARPFEKIFNDNRAHIRIRARERREIEEGGGTIVQYRVYAEGGMYALSLVGRENEWMNELQEWMELLVMHSDLKASRERPECTNESTTTTTTATVSQPFRMRTRRKYHDENLGCMEAYPNLALTYTLERLLLIVWC